MFRNTEFVRRSLSSALIYLANDAFPAAFDDASKSDCANWQADDAKNRQDYDNLRQRFNQIFHPDSWHNLWSDIINNIFGFRSDKWRNILLPSVQDALKELFHTLHISDENWFQKINFNHYGNRTINDLLLDLLADLRANLAEAQRIANCRPSEQPATKRVPFLVEREYGMRPSNKKIRPLAPVSVPSGEWSPNAKTALKVVGITIGAGVVAYLAAPAVLAYLGGLTLTEAAASALAILAAGGIFSSSSKAQAATPADPLLPQVPLVIRPGKQALPARLPANVVGWQYPNKIVVAPSNGKVVHPSLIDGKRTHEGHPFFVYESADKLHKALLVNEADFQAFEFQLPEAINWQVISLETGLMKPVQKRPY